MCITGCGDTAMVTEFVRMGANLNAQDMVRAIVCCTAVR
jgi:hypothetical protein